MADWSGDNDQQHADDVLRGHLRFRYSPGQVGTDDLPRIIRRYGNSPGQPEAENVSRNMTRYGRSPGRTKPENMLRNLPWHGSRPGTRPTAHYNSVYSAVSFVEDGAMTDEIDYEDSEALLDFSVGARCHHQRRDIVDRRDRRTSHNTCDMPALAREGVNNTGYYSDGYTPRIKSEENDPVELNGLSSGSNGIRPRFGEKRGMLPSSVMPDMFPLFPGEAFNGRPGKQDSGRPTAPKAENGRSAKSVNFTERAPASGRDHPTGVSSIDLATAQMMAANSEDMSMHYRKYIVALQEQLRLQGSPGGSTSSSTSAGHNSDIHSAINSPTDRPDPHPDRSDTYPERPDEDPRHAPGARFLIPPSTTIPGSAANITGSRSLYSRVPSTHIRRRGSTLSEDQKDDTYWERRRKNNESAKRSRDAKRAKEDETVTRIAFLEQENSEAQVEVAALKNETAKLRCMLYNS